MRASFGLYLNNEGPVPYEQFILNPGQFLSTVTTIVDVVSDKSTLSLRNISESEQTYSDAGGMTAYIYILKLN